MFSGISCQPPLLALTLFFWPMHENLFVSIVAGVRLWTKRGGNENCVWIQQELESLSHEVVRLCVLVHFLCILWAITIYLLTCHCLDFFFLYLQGHDAQGLSIPCWVLKRNTLVFHRVAVTAGVCFSTFLIGSLQQFALSVAVQF